MAGKVVIDDRAWRRILRLAESKTPHAKVGILASKGGGSPHGNSGTTIAEIAAFHEFGTRAVPERSFIRRTFREKRREFRQMAAKLTRGVLQGTTRGGMSLKRALELLGSWGAAEVKKTITIDGVPPPLASTTVAKKGSSRALVDTGQLLNSITHEVEL